MDGSAEVSVTYCISVRSALPEEQVDQRAGLYSVQSYIDRYTYFCELLLSRFHNAGERERVSDGGLDATCANSSRTIEVYEMHGMPPFQFVLTL